MTGGDDGKVKLLDLSTGKLSFTVNSHHGALSCLKFSKHGDYFATGGEDKLSMVWKTHFLSSGKEVLEAEDYMNVCDTNTQRHQMDKENYVSCLRKMTKIGKKTTEHDRLMYIQDMKGDYLNKYGENEYGASGDKNAVKYVLPADIERKMEKIGSYLDVINNSIQVMGERIVNNDKAINSVADYLANKYNYNPLTGQKSEYYKKPDPERKLSAD